MLQGFGSMFHYFFSVDSFALTFIWHWYCTTLFLPFWYNNNTIKSIPCKSMCEKFLNAVFKIWRVFNFYFNFVHRFSIQFYIKKKLLASIFFVFSNCFVFLPLIGLALISSEFWANQWTVFIMQAYERLEKKGILSDVLFITLFLSF